MAVKAAPATMCQTGIPETPDAALPVGFSVRASSAAATGGWPRAASILEVDSHQRGSDDPWLPSSSRD